MAHSKRNTALPHFTSHERSLLKHTWGSQSTRLTRDSYLPFGSCLLCLQLASEPVACPIGGEIFCRECILRNLVAQKNEIERLKRVSERERGEEEGRKGVLEEERREGERERFERVSQGLEGAGVKRKAEMMVDGFRRGGDDDYGGKDGGDGGDGRDEGGKKKKRSGKAESSFWVPGKTPEARKEVRDVERLRPLCPGSLEGGVGVGGKHELGLKGLVGVRFSYSEKKSKEAEAEQGGKGPICPACVKKLSNAGKGVMGVPCGHVVCKSCAGTLGGEEDERGKVKGRRCYVCEESLAEGEDGGGEEDGGERNGGAGEGVEVAGKKTKRKKDGAAKGAKRGIVELRCEGTGFAGGGENVVKKAGTAFQC